MKRTILITLLFSIALFIPAVIVGDPTGSSWLLLIPAVPLMVLGGGVEEVGWRGFLHPALEKKMQYVPAVLTVTVIGFAWHVPLWLIQPSIAIWQRMETRNE